MCFAHAQSDMDHTTASTDGCGLLALACLNPTRPAMAIASSTDAGSELLLRSPPRAKSKVWQCFGFRKDFGEIVDTNFSLMPSPFSPPNAKRVWSPNSKFLAL